MFFLLWITSILVCFIITIFPIKEENPLNGKKDVSDYLEKIIECSLICCTFILIVCNRTHDDMLNYQYSYIGTLSSNSAKETLYWGLRTFAYNLGLNFFQFREIVVFLSGLCCILAIKKANVKVSSVLLFYLPVVVFMDSIQFRNATCLFILLLALHLLNNKSKMFFFVVVIVALSQIHSAFYFYLTLLVLYVDETKRKWLLGSIVVGSIVLGMLTFLNGNKVPFVNDVLAIFLDSSDSRYTRYSTSGKFGFLYPLIVHCSTLLFLLYLQKRKNLIGNDRVLVKNITGLLACSYAVIPFMMMNMNYYRILRNAYVASLIAFMILFREFKSDAFGRFFLFLGVTTIAGLWVVFELGIFNSIDSILDPFFSDGVWFLDNTTGVVQ